MIRHLRAAGQVLLGVILLPVLLPYGARRFRRALVRTTRRLTKPLRLWWIDHSAACSRVEIERLLDLRDDLKKRGPTKYLASQLEHLGWLEQIEHLNLVRLDKRRQEIARWEA